MRPIITILIALTLTACASKIPNRNPVGETFPTVQGASLEEEPIALPEDLKGKPAVLIVAYEQDAQFDVDRWLLGLMQLETPIEQLYEVPTVKGLVPGLIAGRIDEGMRSGIPEEDWASVVTVYDDAEKIVAFTGNENDLNARVALLDASGEVVWFHDRGFSPRVAKELDAKVRGLSAP